MRYGGVFGGFPGTRTRLLELARMVRAAYSHSLEEVTTACAVAGEGPVSELRWGPGAEDSFWVKLLPDGEVLIVNSGTEGFLTLLKELQIPNQAAYEKEPEFQASQWFMERGDLIAARFLLYKPTLDALYPGGWIIRCVGHSLGAAEMLCAATRLVTDGLNVDSLSLISFGCPRVLNPAAAAELGLRHLRVHGAGDMVTYLPPSFLVVEVPPFPLTGGTIRITPKPFQVLLFFQHQGRGMLLENFGQLTFTDFDPEQFPIAYLDILFGFLTGGINSHSISTYIDRLNLLEDNTEVVLEFQNDLFPGGHGPMATVKCNMYLAQTLGQGWTEGFYIVGGDVNQALGLLGQAADLRRQCLASDGVITALRVSDEGISGDSLLRRVTLKSSLALGISEAYYANLMFRWYGGIGGFAGSTYRRNAYFGLVPDDTIAGGIYKPTGNPAFNSAVLAYHNFLIANGNICMRNWDKGQPIVSVNDVVIGAAPPVTNKAVVTLSGAHGIPAGTTVKAKLSGIKWVGVDKPPHGTIDARYISANSFSIEGVLFGSNVYKSGGKFQLRAYVYTPVKVISIEKATSHKRGKPFGLAAGRRKVQMQG